MSEPNRVELLRDFYESFDFKTFAEGGLADRLARYSRPDFLFAPPAQYPDAGEIRGIEGVKAFLQMMTNVWDEWAFAPEEFLEGDDLVVVLVRLHARGKESGVELDAAPAHVWHFDGDEATGMQVFLDRAEGLAAAGLESGA